MRPESRGVLAITSLGAAASSCPIDLHGRSSAQEQLAALIAQGKGKQSCP